MDKILITAFRTEIATAILNSQEKLNPDGDAYINEAELPTVLDFFGETDVKKLLKPENNDSSISIFDNKEKQGKSNEINEDEINEDEFNEFMNPDNKVLKSDGTAAYELQNVVASDLLTSSIGTPYEAQMKSLYEEKKAQLRKTGDASEIEAKIDALNEAVQEYIRMHQQDVTKTLVGNGVVKSFKYGTDREKNGYYIQTFSVKANNTINDNDTNNNADDNLTENIDNTDNTNIASENKAVGGITYNIEVVTDKLHAIGHIDSDTENSDITAVAVYGNKLKNGANLNFSGNFRQTIEKNNNRTNIGASFDYKYKKFSTGSYGVYEREENDASKQITTSFEGYAKYGKTLRGAIGYAKETFDGYTNTAKYASVKVTGRKNVNKNITMTGSLEGIYEIFNLDTGDKEEGKSIKEKYPTLNINASGGISFKSNNSDFSANLLANVNIDREKFNYDEYGTIVTSTLLGNISNDKIDVTTTLTSINSPVLQRDENTNDLYEIRKNNWSSSITIGLKKIFGKNVIPSFTYNLNCDDQVKHNISANLGINF